MKTITLTDEEYYLLKKLFERIDRQLERKTIKKKWVKHDGLMINLQTGEALDISSNKFVIDVNPELLAYLIETNDLQAASEHRIDQRNADAASAADPELRRNVVDPELRRSEHRIDQSSADAASANEHTDIFIP